jgi:hypothetical protein
MTGASGSSISLCEQAQGRSVIRSLTSWTSARVGAVGATLALALTLTISEGRAGAGSHEVGGHAGFLGEWELSAVVTERAADGLGLRGPLTLRHTGLCSVNGPEEKSGEIRLSVSPASGQVNATLVIDGNACTYSGGLQTDGNGLLRCPNTPAVPLTLWMK